MVHTMTSGLNQGRFPILEKRTEPGTVAYSRFQGIVNVPSRIWMVRDWAKRKGYHLIGAPCCVYHFNGGGPEKAQCEIRWRIAESVEPFEGEISVRWLSARRVLATFHLGDTVGLPSSAEAVRAWGEAQGYRVGCEPCELYWFDAKAPMGEWITELQLPIEEDETDRSP